MVACSSPAAAMGYPYPRGHLLLAYLCLVPLQAAALSFHYDFSVPGDLDSADLMYINDSSRAGDRIDLTAMTNGSAGRVAHRQPVRLWDSLTGKGASFTTSFSFAIGGNRSNTRGDGMAFFIGPFPPSLPPDSLAGFLGLFNNPNNMGSPPIVGVEFDTFWNRELDPADIAADHVGIDVNSIHSTNYTKDMPNLGLYDTMWANIAYDAGSKVMAVVLRLADGSTHRVQAPVDFRAAGVPQDAAVGFSAATGTFWESHQLLTWSFNSTDIADLPLTDPSSKTKSWILPVHDAACALLAAGLLAALVYIIITRRRFRRGAMKISLPVAREFPYHELVSATHNFSVDRMLGAGSFGEVYRGNLRDPHAPAVAVKKLTQQLEQTRKDYVTEIMTLGQLNHRNLVKLVGWCDGGGNDRLLLVYELMTNMSVDKHLHDSERLLTWPERYRIVLGIGHAIEYLHTGCNNLIILHRDIKPSNVMLDDAFEAKLGDFGLVRQVYPGQSSLGGTAMVGSLDYMDPSCITTRTVSTASDMYSFGVLLLEIATGRKPSVLQQGLASLSNCLVNDVRESYGQGTVLEMADKRLKYTEFDWSQMERVLVVGLLCVQPNRQHRLEIRDAVSLLSNLSHSVPELRVCMIGKD